MMSTMKAVHMHAFGGPEVLVYGDAPKPEPSSREVLIRVKAVGVNPVDWKIREGGLGSLIEKKLPHILGCDVAGIVEDVGDEVTNFRSGDPVYGYIALHRDGGYAQYVVAADTEIAHKPRILDFLEAAAIPVGALTSWQALVEFAKLEEDEKVLIHAASGGVGSLAVQLAKAKGAYVYGTASERNADFVKGLGIDEFIDYNAQKFEEVVKDADVVFDTIGGETQTRSLEVLKKGSRLVSIVTPPSEELAEQHGVTVGFVSVAPNGGQVERMSRLFAQSKLKPHIARVMPLAEVRQAHEASQAGHVRGKIILHPPT
ncbi:MAG: NADP-dependent oxidoreductase [Gemmataceae bacterium]